MSSKISGMSFFSSIFHGAGGIYCKQGWADEPCMGRQGVPSDVMELGEKNQRVAKYG
jgi:hypothetical protein